MPKISWDELRAKYSTPDNLPCREVGSWSADKLFFWHTYIQITTQAMVGKPSWKAGVVYVDLFSGPGVCQDRDTRARYPGSPIIAAHAAKHFTKIIACDLNPTNTSAVEQRLRASGTTASIKVFTGDSNALIPQITKEIPPGALTLAFLDPEALQLRFDTVRSMSTCGRVDLLILIPDAFDIVRNVDEYYKSRRSKLDYFLGEDSQWRQHWDAITNRSGNNVREFFRDFYINRLKSTLGYQKVAFKPIEGPNGPLYTLVFASKHERGLEFWDKTTEKARGGQKELF
jgi:three-Cys-motif partner protein